MKHQTRKFMISLATAAAMLGQVCDGIAAQELRPLAAGEKGKGYRLERLLKEELARDPWVLISRPRRDDQCPRYVYRCGSRIIHIPTTLKSLASAAVAHQNLGKRIAPTTRVDDITLRADVIETIRPRIPGRARRQQLPSAWQPPRTIYVQEFVNPLTGLNEEAMRKGMRWVEGGLLAALSNNGEAGIARAKRIIDDYFDALEEMWVAGIFNLDAILINAGADIDDTVRFFDLGGFAEVRTIEEAIALANEHIPEILKRDEDEDMQDAALGIQEYFISQAQKRLTVANMIRHWESGFGEGFNSRRRADEVGITLFPTQNLVKGKIPESDIIQEERRLINEGWAVAWDLKTADRVLKILEKEGRPTGGECNYLLRLLFPKKGLFAFLSAGPIPQGAREALQANLGSGVERKKLAAAIRKQKDSLSDISHNSRTYRGLFKREYQVRAGRSIEGDSETDTPALASRVFVTCFSGEGYFSAMQVLGHSSLQNNTIAMHINSINGLETEGLGLAMLHEHMDAIRGAHQEDISDDAFNVRIRYPWQEMLARRQGGEKEAAGLIQQRRKQAVDEAIAVITTNIAPLNRSATKIIDDIMTDAAGKPTAIRIPDVIWQEYLDMFKLVCDVLSRYGIHEGELLRAELSKTKPSPVNISSILSGIFLESGKLFVFVHSERQLGNFAIRSIPKIVIYDIREHGPQRDIDIRGTKVSLYVAYSRGYILSPLIKEEEVFMNTYLGVQVRGLQLVVVNENRYEQEVQDYYEVRKSIYLYDRLPDKMITSDENYNNACKELIKRQWLDDAFKRYVDMDIQGGENSTAGKTAFFDKHYQRYIRDSLRHEACHEAVRPITTHGGSEFLTNLYDFGESEYRWIRMLLLARDIILMPTPEYRAMHEYVTGHTLPLAVQEAGLGTGPGMTRKELLLVMAQLPKDVLNRKCMADFDELRGMFARGARVSDIRRKAISAVEANI